MNGQFDYLGNGAASYTGKENEAVSFVIDRQLSDEAIWKKFTDAFAVRQDSADHGWRGEYFGKMMRGACLTYRYRSDETLYRILENTVIALLEKQEPNGRISSYLVENELSGWDMWCRKYVLVGCLYFYGICKDDALKERILSAMRAHVDYILARVGAEKKPIVKTSEIYGGMNSCTILEPIVALYQLTKEARYLAFAEYIISVGGCESGSLIDLVNQGKYPYTFPEVKAYEMMSFFEGVLAYYEATGKRDYLETVEKFVKAVKESDITVIGCAGCTHELFDHSAVKQTEEAKNDAIMQETCVTVTWMRLNDRLLRLTGNAVYAENIERSAYNALYGSLNIAGNDQYCVEKRAMIAGLPFDSYSPLVNQKRGIGIGGYKEFADGGYYGCCGCIGAAGIALFPLCGVQSAADGFVLNEYLKGDIRCETADGKYVSFAISESAVESGSAKITVSLSAPSVFSLRLRIPEWSNSATVSVNGKVERVSVGYHTVAREWADGDRVEVCLNPELKSETLNGKQSFRYGAFVLARDEQKESGDITKPFLPLVRDGKLVYDLLTPQAGESVRLTLTTVDGEKVLLTDYASCGKKWLEEKCRISVWFERA